LGRLPFFGAEAPGIRAPNSVGAPASARCSAVLDTVGEWRSRPLEASYPLVFFDALRVKNRDEGVVRKKAIYVALGVQEGYRRPVDQKHRTRQILAAGGERIEEPGRQ
jgi:hypothetical protein